MFVKTLNITDSVSNIETSTTYKYYWVRNLGAEDVSVFKAPSDADTNKKIILSQDEYVKIIPENNNIYFKSSSTGTKIEVYGTNTDICPFKVGNVKERGGDGGGGRTETVLWENTGTTNPDTIALSEAYTNFDEVMFCLNTNIANRGSASNTYLADDIIVGSDNLYGVELSAEIYVWYKCSSSTALALYVEGSQATLTKIVGIKY